MTLPGPETTHGWRGRTLVDRNGERVGSIENIYLDQATGQPEWALLSSRALRAPTFVPLISAIDEGDTVRTPFEKTLVEGAPSVPAGRDISEDQEEELYRHYGIPYSRVESPSGLPANQAEPSGRPASATPLDPPVSEATVTAQPEPASGPSAAEVAASPSRAAGAGNGPAVRARGRLNDPRVVATAGAVALGLAAGAWRRKLIARQMSTAISGLAGVPERLSRRRRQRRRAKAFDRAVTTATQRATAMAETTTRILGAVSLLSVATGIQTGRRAWSALQAAQQQVRQRGRPARSGARRRGTPRRRTSGMVVPGAAAISRLPAIAGTAKRGGRKRRRELNRSVARGAQQAGTLASSVARPLAGAAAVPVPVAARGVRRARSTVQAAQRGVGQGGKRLRPASRGRRQRGGPFGVVVGGVAGYVLGARAGEPRYQEIAQTAKRLTERPELNRAKELAVARLDQLCGRAADKLEQSRQRDRGEPASGRSQPLAAPVDVPPEAP